MNLDEIIEYDEESTNLDFKREEYNKSNYVALLKDVISMSNTLNSDIKRIIIGVKDKPGEEKEFVGIENITDQATLENVIQENVEPNINFKYYAYNYNGTKLGIIEICDNFDKPYMMKKDYSNLKRGDMWIRKGSRQSRVTRADLDKMLDSRKKVTFENKIEIGFGKNLKKEICISKTSIEKESFPSEVRKKELEELIKKLDERYSIDIENGSSNSLLDKFEPLNLGFFGEFRDSDKSIRVGYESITNFPVYNNKKQILESIENALHDYYEEDCYFIYEVNSTKFNCLIYVDSTEFLEDVKIELFFDPDIFIISEKIYTKPIREPSYLRKLDVYDQIYPNVYEADELIVVETYHEQIRHKTLSKIFLEDLRILTKLNIVNKESEVKYRIGAKNLSDHVEGTVRIIIN